MDFGSEATRKTYSDRQADESWLAWCESNLRPQNKDVADVACGGGIYSIAFAALGAKAVIGVDASSQYVAESERQVGPGQKVLFKQGTAVRTGLAQESMDFVFERALVHHLSDDEKALNLQEAYRILRAQGIVCVQDRTFEDVQSRSPQHWIRATLFETFPQLLDWEKLRRPQREGYLEMMARAGFADVFAVQLDEVRRTYASYDELKVEIMSRKGKSVLFELNDEELRHYCHKLEDRAEVEPLVEVDSWTIWKGRKSAT